MTFEVPTDLAVDRLANAMAAGRGWAWDQMDDESRAAMRKDANSVLIYQGIAHSPPTGAPHLAKRLEGIVAALRHAGEAMDADPQKWFAEPMIRAMYASATDAEAVARILQGLPEPVSGSVEAI